MNRLIQKTFENRGYTDEFLSDIDCFDHAELLDIDVMAEKLHNAYLNQYPVVVFSDFDMDGIMSGVTGFSGLSELGFRVSLFIPNPNDGYGFDAATIDKLLGDYPDTKVIVTCDVGISCKDGIERAKELGIQVLVTDHHIQKSVIHAADCIVDPKRLDETYKNPSICGAYVLYQCLQYYADKYANGFAQEQIRRLRVFAGIGTISDIMPLYYENRQIVRDSVAISRLVYSCNDDTIVNSIMGCDIYRRAFYGLYVVYDVLSQFDVIKSYEDITESLYAYYLTPMFNSIKRMGGDMTTAFGVFFGPNPAEDMERLFMLNNQRKIEVDRYMTEIDESDNPYAPYIYFTDARAGIRGLLANQLMSLNGGIPCVVLGSDLKGSGRSPSWYNFFIRANEAGFYVGGHDTAFGIGLTDKRELKAFYTFLKKDVMDVYQELDIQSTEVRPDFVIALDNSGDTTIDIMLFAEYLADLEYYRPFGAGFPSPNILLKFHVNDGKWKVIGKTKEHLKIELPYGFSVLCFYQADLFDKKDTFTECHVWGHLNKNKFNGTTTIQFIGTLTTDD